MGTSHINKDDIKISTHPGRGAPEGVNIVKSADLTCN